MENERNYGRKVIRDGQGIRYTKKKPDVYVKRFFAILIAAFLLGGLLGSIITGLVVHHQDMKKIQVSEAEAEVILSTTYGSGNNQVTRNNEFTWSSGEESGFIPLNVDMDEDLQEFVYSLCSAYDIDWTLVMAMIDHESSFRSNVISKTNDYGLMQINECNHSWLSENLGVTDFLDEEENIRCGVYILRGLFEQYDNTHKVLMAYNMGEDGASRLWEAGIYSTPYSETITDIQAQYQTQIEERMVQENDN